MPLYALATALRDEAEVLPQLLLTVDAQSARPSLWVVVDDGSKDGSRGILEEAAKTRPWLVVVPGPEANHEYLGGHIARVKRFGVEQALRWSAENGVALDYVGVLDADIELPPNHYRELMAAFDADAELGVVSSVLHVAGQHGHEPEPYQRDDLPRGPTQLFRRLCLEQIGGLPPYPGYDGAANVKAQLAGWKTRLLRDTVALHKRPTATRYGEAPGFERKGRYAWFLGVHPLIVLARAAAYSKSAPHSAGFYFAKGWLMDAVKRSPRCPDQALRRAYGWPRLVQVASALFRRGTGYVSAVKPR